MKRVDRIPLDSDHLKSFVREGTTASGQSVVTEPLKEFS